MEAHLFVDILHFSEEAQSVSRVHSHFSLGVEDEEEE